MGAWASLLPLLLGLGGASALAVGVELRRQSKTASLPAISAALSQRARNATQPRPRLTGPNRFRPFDASGVVRLFGMPTADDYPAPYRYQDARAIADIVLSAASETSPKLAPYFAHLVTMLRRIEAAHLPKWRKTYAAIMVVVIPALASNVLWHWYRKDGRSRLKEDRFNAIASWAALFSTLPATATSAATVAPYIAGSSLLRNVSAYLDPSTRLRRGSLDAVEMRRCLYDVSSYMTNWAAMNPQFGGGEGVEDEAALARSRMAGLNEAYPQSDPDVFVVEGNIRAADEIVWYANARVQGSISIDWDEGAAIAMLVGRTVAAIVSAVAPAAGGAIAAGLQVASTAINALAQLAVGGTITAAQFQALAGAGVAFMLDQAGIRLGLDDEMAQVEAMAAQL